MKVLTPEVAAWLADCLVVNKHYLPDAPAITMLRAIADGTVVCLSHTSEAESAAPAQQAAGAALPRSKSEAKRLTIQSGGSPRLLDEAVPKQEAVAEVTFNFSASGLGVRLLKPLSVGTKLYTRSEALPSREAILRAVECSPKVMLTEKDANALTDAVCGLLHQDKPQRD